MIKGNMKRINIFLLVCIVLFITITSNSFAAYKRETITVGKNQVWNTRPTISRSGAFKTVVARVFSVYPSGGGPDLFTTIQTQLVSSSGVELTYIYNLNENNSSSTTMQIKEGYLGYRNVNFRFRGNNSSYSARADVEYNSR